MLAAAETLDLKWKQAGINVLTVGHAPEYEIFQLLYVDDGAFPFPTRSNLVKGLALIHSHLARFGLEVHISRGGNPSKTECVFSPPPPIFQRQT
jgi:hypothetical protein